MEPMTLHPDHRAMLELESGLSRDVIDARGYQTVTIKAELRRLGFSQAQSLVPGLLIPILSVNGDIPLHQLRPDHPRMRKGKSIKYETTAGGQMALDCHPFVRHQLGDPNIPLLLTEGVKKGDCLVSRGCCALSLLGVWNWRGRNAEGGKTALADWEYVALNGRTVYVVFDSDVMTKAPVREAMTRLGAFLEGRGATVRYVYLPCGKSGNKTGVDDFLIAGHTIDDLVKLASDTLLRAVSDRDDQLPHPYRLRAHGIALVKHTDQGSEEFLLTNFGATITAERLVDNGAEVLRTYDIEARLRQDRIQCTVPAEQFGKVDQWVPLYLGARAVLPERRKQDLVRQAIQLLSPHILTVHEYGHTGFRMINGKPVYLHAAGGIGAEGSVPDVQVCLNPRLSRMTLTATGSDETLMQALRAACDLLNLPDMLALIATACIAPLAELLGVDRPDYVLWVHGPTGAHKSERAALAQALFGDFTRQTLPASFKDTPSAVEKLLFEAKDALIVLDDFHPASNPAEAARMAELAAKVVRGVGNGTGRSRMKADLTRRPDYPPRGMVIVTAERLLEGHSNTSRLLPVSVMPIKDMDRLTKAQASRHLLPYAMAAYVQSLARRCEDLRVSLPARFRHYRQEAQQGCAHNREPGQIAHLRLGINMFLEFLACRGILTTEEQQRWQAHAHQTFLAMSREHATNLCGESVTERFRNLLVSGFAAKIAYLEGKDGGEPTDDPGLWGWHVFYSDGEDGTEDRQCRPAAGAKLIGRVNDPFIDLFPEALYPFLVGAAKSAGQVFPVDLSTLVKRLQEAGWIETESDGHLKAQAKINGKKMRVIRLSQDALYSEEETAERIGPTVPTTADTLGTSPAPDNGVILYGKEAAVPSVPTVPSLLYISPPDVSGTRQEPGKSITHEGNGKNLFSSEPGYTGYAGYRDTILPVTDRETELVVIDLTTEAE